MRERRDNQWVGKNPVKTYLISILICTVVSLMIIDTALTYHGLIRGYEEVNPMLRIFLQLYTVLFAVCGYAIVMCAVFIIAMFYLSSRYPKTTICLGIVGVLSRGSAVISNLFQLRGL